MMFKFKIINRTNSMYHQGTDTFLSRYKKGFRKPYYLKRELNPLII